jgi:hypothetical protein
VEHNLFCKLCAIAKAKEKNVPKETSGANKATEFNGQVFHDLSKIKVPEELGKIEIAKSNWHIAVNEASGYKRSAFLSQKGESLSTCANTCTARRNKDT